MTDCSDGEINQLISRIHDLIRECDKTISGQTQDESSQLELDCRNRIWSVVEQLKRKRACLEKMRDLSEWALRKKELLEDDNERRVQIRRWLTNPDGTANPEDGGAYGVLDVLMDILVAGSQKEIGRLDSKSGSGKRSRHRATPTFG